MGELTPKIEETTCPIEAAEEIGITADERAQWLVDYVVLHQGDDRSHLLRRAVEQITAAEANAYARGWRDGEKSAALKASILLRRAC
jgi:hypothetical protein